MRMIRFLLLAVGLVLFPVHDVFAVSSARQAATGQAQASAATRVTTVTITVPHETTEVFLEGKTMFGTGLTRTFDLPPLAAGTHKFTFMARWRPNTYTEMTRTRTVEVRAGEPLTLDLSKDDPTDRVRVIYVPTPEDVGREMVKLAGVTADDIVYEPGCGDARITIAAVKAGAKRGVGVDIDPERVEESRANVKAAGLEDRVEIRQGDALDVKNITAATVVFLYMGDHFNMLIRPVLWRELPVGARIVSHRFLMGDWKPDKTVTVTSDDGGEYDLHLWTITEEIKKKASEGAR